MSEIKSFKELVLTTLYDLEVCGGGTMFIYVPPRVLRASPFPYYLDEGARIFVEIDLDDEDFKVLFEAGLCDTEFTTDFSQAQKEMKKDSAGDDELLHVHGVVIDSRKAGHVVSELITSINLDIEIINMTRYEATQSVSWESFLRQNRPDDAFIYRYMRKNLR